MTDLSQIGISALLLDIHQFYNLTDKKGIKPEELKRWFGVESDAVLQQARSYAMGKKKAKEVKDQSYLRPILEKLNNGRSNENRDFQKILFAEKLTLPSEGLDTVIWSSAKGDFSESWRLFTSACERIKDQSGKVRLENLCYLLEKYAAFVPCSWQHLPDVSFYDHAKTVAAFAVALKLFGNEQADKEKTPFLLIGGDLSGIQKFIYNIVSKNAAKNLKGRSFYLQLLIDSVIQLTLEKLNLFRANVVYASGGGFYLIAPNTKTAREALESLCAELSDKLYNRHKTDLFLAMDAIPFGASVGEDISKVWESLSERLNQKKRSRYSDKIAADDGYAAFFGTVEEGGLRGRDAITNEEFSEKEEAVINTILADHEVLKRTKLVHFLNHPIIDKESAIKKTTFEQIELGRILKNATYWVSAFEDFGGLTTFNPCDFGVYHHFVETEKRVPNKQYSTIRSINHTDFERYVKAEQVWGYAFYGGNDFPVFKEGESDEDGKVVGRHQIGFPKTFGALAKSGGSLHRLGVLRMDVDNLGQAFINGFHESQRTFSRYSALSRSLDFFFIGYLNTIWKRHYSANTYILYSGGDDLFILGQWEAVLEFGMAINEAFGVWTAGNPTLSVSGGMEMVTGKFPIVKAAALAEDAEKAAKAYAYKDKEKNAFCFLRKTLQWDNEWKQTIALKNQLEQIGDNSSILNKIQALAAMQKDYFNGKTKTPKWMWMSAYVFSQHAKRYKRDAALMDTFKIGVVSGQTNEGKLVAPKTNSYLQLLALAARWIELHNRSINKNKK
ncbi:MAG: hypothetical protein AB8B69_07810 [Chitinophagales bacterium]